MAEKSGGQSPVTEKHKDQYEESKIDVNLSGSKDKLEAYPRSKEGKVLLEEDATKQGYTEAGAVKKAVDTTSTEHTAVSHEKQKKQATGGKQTQKVAAQNSSSKPKITEEKSLQGSQQGSTQSGGSTDKLSKPNDSRGRSSKQPSAKDSSKEHQRVTISRHVQEKAYMNEHRKTKDAGDKESSESQMRQMGDQKLSKEGKKIKGAGSTTSNRNKGESAITSSKEQKTTHSGSDQGLKNTSTALKVAKEANRSGPGTGEVMVKLHALMVPQMWKVDTKQAQIGILTGRNWKQIHLCSSILNVDKDTIDMEVTLYMTQTEFHREFQYKYYVQEKGRGQYESFGDPKFGFYNRILDPNFSWIYDKNEKCYHHYDGCIVPQSVDTETPWYSNPLNYFFKSGASGTKQFDDLRCQSLLHYLKGFSENLQGPACIDVLCQSKFAEAVEQISGVYTQIKDMRLRNAKYVAGSPDLVPCKSVSQVFVKWIADVVETVKQLPQEFPEIAAKVKVSGCALVAIVCRSNLLESITGDILQALVNVLKYSGSCKEEHLFQCHKHLQELLPISIDNRAYRSELFTYLKDFWLQVASTDQMHFSILPLLFHVKGCFQPGKELSQSVFTLLDKPTLKRIAERKTSEFMKTVKECLFLIDSLFCPSLAEMVLPLASVQKWSNSDLLPMLPLGDVLEYLNSCIDKDREKMVEDAGQCMMKISSNFNKGSRRDVSASIKPAFRVASAVLSVHYVDLGVVKATSQLCLWLCSYATKRDEVDKLLQDMCSDVVKGIRAYGSKKHWANKKDTEQFGCTKLGCQRHEFQVWSEMLRLKGEESVKIMWIGKCTASIIQRFQMLPSMHEKLSIMEREYTVSEEMEKILLNDLLESFGKLSEKEMRNLVASRSRRIQDLLLKYLNRKYPQPEDITFEELCSWSLWHHCFKVFTKSSWSVHGNAVENAKAILDSVVETIPEKGITVENLRVVTSHRKNFEDMVKALFEVQGKGEQSVDILKMIPSCQSSVSAFDEALLRLDFLHREIRKFMTGKGAAQCDELRRFCEKDVEGFTVATLEGHLVTSSLVATVQSMYCQFYSAFKVHQNDVTAKLWSEFAGKVDSFECLANELWPRFYDSLKEIANRMKKLDIPCEEALKLLPPGRAKKIPELKKLVHALDECEGRPPSDCDAWIEQIMYQTKVYSDARRVSENAQHLLEVKEALQLTGNFDGAENIAHIEEKLGPKLLSVVNVDDLAKHAAFLAHFDRYHSSLIQVGQSRDIIEWMKTLGDASQLQTFTNIALITQCEDASSVDRLTSLETVGTKMAPIIFHLPKSAGMLELMNRCKHIEGGLEKIAEHMDTCNKSLEWYKRIQGTLGSVEETAYGQLTDLTEAGKYTIAIPGGKIPEDIKELVQVEIVERATPKTAYTLEELKDLQSKLALIKGKISKPDFNKKTDTFWQGLELTVRIASCLLDLLLVGHMKYRMFTCTYSLNADGVVNDMKIRAKEMESDLEDWNNTVDSLRSQHYHLNYFTARQLSVICQELSVYSGRHSPINPWLLNLLESLSPSVVEESVRSAIEDIIAERDERKLKSFLGTSRDDDVQPGSKTVNAEMEMEEPDEMTAMQEQKQELESSPALKAEDLTEEQHELFEELLALEYAENHILCGLVECGNDFDAIEDYCLKRSSEDVEEASMETDISQKTSGLLTMEAEQEKELPIDEDHPTVKGLLDAGFPLLLALEAVKTCPQEDDAFDYCLDNEKGRGTLPSNKSDDVTASFILPFTVNVRKEDLWTLEDVGRFLDLVAGKHKEATLKYFPEERDFKFFAKGKPNVVVVPRRDIFHDVLSLYMHSKDLPMPTAEEVLHCHSTTTAEEIRLLWRRAVCDPGYSRIFCLICEHNLSYKIAKEAVQDLRDLMQGHKDFKLVIMCCKEDENSSLLLGDLRDYKKSLPPRPPRKEVMDYIKSHFVNDVVKFGPDLSEVGATVDPDNSYVRVVASGRAGMGKSLYINRLLEEFKEQRASLCQIVPLHGPDVNNDIVAKALRSVEDTLDKPVVYHLDISERITDDIGGILFNMLILRALQDSQGSVWRCKLKNLYAIEVTVPALKEDSGENTEKMISNSVELLQLLPTAKCLSPKECVRLHGTQNQSTTTRLVEMDERRRLEASYQRVYQYLCRREQSVDKFEFNPNITEGTAVEWIQRIMSFFSLESRDPSWVELYRFTSFLDTQLKASEHSIYCDESIVGDASQGVYGFKSFVVKFMIRMSVDFTVPSLKSAYEDQPVDAAENVNDLEGYQIVERRAWENSVHPYIFFNRDKTTQAVGYDSMTFIGFNFHLSGKTVNLVSLAGEVLEGSIMPEGLFQWLRSSGVEMRQNPQLWQKIDILKKLFRVFESSLKVDPEESYYKQVDPDDTYALTYDNLVKMLAIQMRFRCGIPVVIMGETGCGKTRLIRYMCQLQAKFKANKGEDPRQTFFILKVHGGTTEDTIVNFVQTVQEEAHANQEVGLDTVLFFDEANTTDAIGLIKEIMCDKRMKGIPITEDIKFIAACNPYRKHSENMIEKLESAGLGFFIQINETKQKLGATPLRHLVYRVLELPASMKPLVYDYGSLNTDTEKTYIRRIAENHVCTNRLLNAVGGLTDAITRVLSWAQDYMRRREDECSYVSLRDVERCMIVFEWFFRVHKAVSDEMVQVGGMKRECLTDPSTMAMIMSIAVCYGSRLIERAEFEEEVTEQFTAPFVLPNGKETYTSMLQCCQEAFLSNMKLGQNIAHNVALRENVFMMAVCVELRIPLFVVGKPGSSKSLAKSIVAESMQQRESKFLKENFKTVKLISYQCSQLSTPESIIDVFKSAKNIQNKLGHASNIALVVLDEVGLAEDSPSLPLKALHPLLEDGTDGSDPRELQIVQRQERVAFIGISNWALDPAKMNRGIMVRRGKPDVQELVASARGICSNEVNDPIREYLEPIMENLAQAYLNIVDKQVGKRKEFFGLRDFYSLIKMIYWLIKNNALDNNRDNEEEEVQLTVSQRQLEHAILRNFGGSDEIDPLEEFEDCFTAENFNIVNEPLKDDPDCTRLGLISASLSSKDRSWHGENRYLLFLTENDAALQIMHNYLFQTGVFPDPPHILFGSSFPRDKDYTQICRNINQIKICMETGRPVVLLNLENLYESLYDLLNQYYTQVQDKRYVDLGLQTHRIKCRVHNDFKLILIAEKDKVYEKFPIPLINRLEKHLVMTSTILRIAEAQLCKRVKEWIKCFTDVSGFKAGDAFIGYQPETPAAVVLHASQKIGQPPDGDDSDQWSVRAFACCKYHLIQMACPDALARLKSTPLKEDAEKIWDMYFCEQQHLCLSQVIKHYTTPEECLPSNESQSSIGPGLLSLESQESFEQSVEDQSPQADDKEMGLLVQVTTHSQPLAPVDISRLCRELVIEKNTLIHMYLEELDAEADFTDRIRKHFETVKKGDTFVIVQCSSGHLNKDLISCARHKALDELQNFRQTALWENEYVVKQRKIHVIFIVSLPKTPGGSKFIAFQGGKWLCIHLDDLRSPEDSQLGFISAVKTPLSQLVYPGCGPIALHTRLRFCIQGALAQIPEDHDRASNRKLKLLQILLELIPENGNADPGEGTFYSVLVRRICTLIEQNERLQTSVTGHEWAVREAMHLHRLQEGGTFTLTLLKRIDKTLTELLAFIVEFVDQNNNLGLCQNEMLGIMWLQIFNNDHLCQLKYEDKSQSADHGNQSLVQRPGTLGAGRYPCKVPFSWLILSGVEAKWKMFGDIDKSAGDIMRTFSDQIQASYLGQLLESVDSGLLPQLADMYLDDFIAGVVQSSSTNETQVLKRYLQIFSEKLLDSEGRKSVLSSFLSIHVTYHINELQIVQYRELGSIFEELHQLVLDGLSADVDEPLDLLAVNLLLERITPKPVTDKEFWKVQNLRDVYIRKLRECLNIVNGIISKPAPGSSILCTVRKSWQKIRAVEMYISHLIIPLPDNDEVTKGAFRLWHVLSRKAANAGFNSKEVIDQCLKILKSVDDCVAKSFGHSDAKMRRLALLKHKSDEKLSDREEAYLKYCNAVKMFFLEMVSVLCFGSGSYEPPQQELIEALMKKVLGDGKTRDLTPLDWEEADANPVIRSVLLQLLLMGRDEDLLTVGKMIEKFIETSSQVLVPTAGKDSSIPVCALVVRCLEDKSFKIFSDFAESANIVRLLENLSHQLDLSIKIYVARTPGSPVTFEWLRSSARLRVCLYLVADLLVHYAKGSPTRELAHRENMMLQQLIQYLSEALQREELQEVTLYLTKQIARRHGMTSLTDLYNQGHRFVLPTRFHSDENATCAQDLLVVCGEDYLNLRRSFMQAFVDSSIESVRSAFQALPQGSMYCFILALFSKLSWPFQPGKYKFSDEMLQETNTLISGFLNEQLLSVCNSVFKGNIGGASTLMHCSQDSSDRILTTLVLHTVTVMLSKTNALLEPFQNILLHPSQLKGKYLPTMPEDPLVLVEDVMAFDGSYRENYGKLFQCPNGHPYLIANCTKPNERSKCPYCGEPIGAISYGQLAEGNCEIHSDARKEIGYVLGAANTRPETALPERELSPMACAVTRFFLHVCYLWSSCHSTEENLMDLRQTVNSNTNDLSAFFWENAKKDLCIIGKTSSRGEDEVAMLLHVVIHNIYQMDATDSDSTLTTKNIRKEWEEAFFRNALTPLQNVTGVVQDTIEQLRKESEMAEDETFMAVYEKTEKVADLTQTLWAYRSRITLEDLGPVLRSTGNPRKKFPLLDYFLADENVFRALQYLPDVVQLQKILVGCYSHRLDHDEAMNTSLGAALKKIASSKEEHRIIYKHLMNTREAWKLVRNHLPNFALYPVPQEYIKIIGDMSEDVSLAYMLPRKSGAGICALALCDYLCLRQNWLLDLCRQKNFSGFYNSKVQVSQLQHFHMVSYEAEIDTVLLTHCRYSLKFGQGQDVEYDLAALQKHIYDRFIVGKPYIDRGTQPMMVFTSDVIRKDVLDQLKEKIKPQISLTSEEKKEVIGRLHHNLTEVSSALQNVTIAMGFLAGDSRPPDMPLGQYISRVLKIKAKVDFCRKYALQHVLSLWETLALDKSRRHSLNGNQVPFDGLTSTIVSKLDSLDSKLKTALNDVLKNFNLDLLLSVLFKFIQMWLPSAEDSYFKCPITDFLGEYIHEFEDNNIRDLESRLSLLPGDILLKHAVDVWHTVVKFHSEFEKE